MELKFLKQLVRDEFWSMSRLRSRKSSSRDVTVSHLGVITGPYFKVRLQGRVQGCMGVRASGKKEAGEGVKVR